MWHHLHDVQVGCSDTLQDIFDDVLRACPFEIELPVFYKSGQRQYDFFETDLGCCAAKNTLEA